MIKSFEIENFRLFDHLKVNRLGRVNLVVGKNNAGKSAFLEAVVLFHTQVCPQVLWKVFDVRQELPIRLPDTIRDVDPEPHPFRFLFNGRELPTTKEQLVSLKANGQAFALGTTRPDDSPEAPPLALQVKKDGDENLFNFFHLNRNRQKPYGGRTPYQWVSPEGIGDVQASGMWENIILYPAQQKQVLTALRLFEPKVETLSFIDRIPFVKLKEEKAKIPLKSFGDGMSRALHLILSMISCEGGVLVVDEFENGLHWSVQPKVWKMIFEMAKKLNIQVFASTHSRDCVAGFHEAWTDNEKDGAFLRLMRGDGQPPVQEYDLELLRHSLESTIEVR